MSNILGREALDAGLKEDELVHGDARKRNKRRLAVVSELLARKREEVEDLRLKLARAEARASELKAEEDRLKQHQERLDPKSEGSDEPNPPLTDHPCW